MSSDGAFRVGCKLCCCLRPLWKRAFARDEAQFDYALLSEEEEQTILRGGGVCRESDGGHREDKHLMRAPPSGRS